VGADSLGKFSTAAGVEDDLWASDASCLEVRFVAPESVFGFAAVAGAIDFLLLVLFELGFGTPFAIRSSSSLALRSRRILLFSSRSSSFLSAAALTLLDFRSFPVLLEPAADDRGCAE
jgi:hypothetical protein